MVSSALIDAPPVPSPLAARLTKVGSALGIVVAAVGLGVIAGSLLDAPALTSLVPGWISMKANTAIGLLLSGAGLALAVADGNPRARTARLVLGGVVLALGAATVLEHVAGMDLGIDQLFVRGGVAVSSVGARPGRPSLISGVNFALVGAALMWLDTGRGWRIRPAETLALAMALLAFVAIEGYVFGKGSLSYVPAFSTVALHTAMAFVALAAGVLAVRPRVGLMRSVTADGVGGATLRRILPAAIVIPLVLGWLRIEGERAGWFDATSDLALIVAAMAVSLIVVTFVTVAPLAREEARSRTAEHVAAERIRRLNRVYEVLSRIRHAIVRERNLSVLFARTCRIAVEQGGFSAAWIALAGAGEPLTIAADAAADPRHGEALRRAVADPAFAASPAARAVTEGHPIIANGVEAGGARLADCPPLAALAAAHGYEAVACFPLRSGQTVRGVLVLAAQDRSVFDEDEVRLIEELATDVGFAMEVSRNDAEGARAEAALRESQARLERAVRAGNIGLWEWSLTAPVVYYSAQWKRQLGYEDHEIAADFEAWRSRVHPDDLQGALAAIGEYLRGRAPHLEIEYRCRHKDGTWRHMLAHATVLLDERGSQIALLGAHMDVTHHTELQAQFLQAQKMESLGRLAGGIAHDFNNLLTIINGTADLALIRLASTGQRDDDWRGVRDAGERATTLTRQLLAISRKQVLQVEVLDPNEVLSGIEGLLRRLIGEDIVLRVALAPDAGRIKADAGQLEQVVVNLAVNARDAMPRGGMLTIETRPVEVVGTMMAAERSPIGPGPYVVISVTDTGEGMDEATRTRAFEPFFTTKDPGKGTGLGLSTVFGIVRQCGGAIRLRSERGAGTTFEVYMPSVTDAARRAKSGPHQTVIRGSETILVVEDEPALRHVARKILENAGYAVLLASNGEEALTHLHRAVSPVHLLLTDVVMPGMSGPALVGRLREEGARTLILYTSGYADDQLTGNGLRDERVHFLGKPYTGTTLLKKVREVLDANKPGVAATGIPGG